MRFFTLYDLHHLILGFFLGCIAALVLYLVFRYKGPEQRPEVGGQKPGAPGEEFPDGLRIGDNPTPPVLIFVFLGFAVWFIFYVIFFGLLGGPV